MRKTVGLVIVTLLLVGECWAGGCNCPYTDERRCIAWYCSTTEWQNCALLQNRDYGCDLESQTIQRGTFGEITAVTNNSQQQKWQQTQDNQKPKTQSTCDPYDAERTCTQEEIDDLSQNSYFSWLQGVQSKKADIDLIEVTDEELTNDEIDETSEEESQNKEENPDWTEENVEEQQDEWEDEALEENGDMDWIIAWKEESTTAEQKQQNPETVKAKSNLGIKMNSDCLVHGGCSLDVYKTLWMRADSWNEDRTSVLSFFQDIIGAATFFIGTIVTIAFVWSGFQCILAGRNGDSSGRAKALKGMLYSIVGLIIVMSSYAIIRLVQYLAATGW